MRLRQLYHTKEIEVLTFADDPEIGRRQLDYVIKNLTPKELNQIEVEITKNENAGTDSWFF